ncbi:MAG: chemotaxis protein CheW [Acidobacteria bacterium]|nr:MAG: chemotaxis protein CheW [Acidobacteriota bacterium]
MLLVLFEVNRDRYGIEAGEVVEVIPLVQLKEVPRAPNYVAGLFNYRGRIVPVVDLGALMGHEKSRPLLSTRIMVVRDPGSGPDGILGLMAGHLTETIDCRPDEFKPSGVSIADGRYLGDILPTAKGMIQRVCVANILNEDVRAVLAVQGRTQTAGMPEEKN